MNDEDLMRDDESPEFDSQEEELLFGQAKLGEEARRFFDSDLGRYVRGCALQEIREAQDAMLKVSPWRKRKIQQHQVKAASCRQAIAWLGEVIAMGDQAHFELLNRRN